jgi:phosphoribosylglycinamide formyltransferase 1
MNIAIFASGNGTNAQRITEYFSGNADIRVSLVASDKKDAFVLQRAQNAGIPTFIFSAKELKDTEVVEKKLEEFNIDFIVLAGFLLKVPHSLINKFPNKIINIHPALLPKYGGKGMYGEHVHKAVINAGDAQSGISIHYVNDNYDEGAVIFQARCDVFINDSPESLAARIHELEYKYYPVIIEKIMKGETF